MTKRVVNTRSLRNARLDEELDEINKEKDKILNPGSEPEKNELPNNLANPEDKTDWFKRHNDVKSYLSKQINDIRNENQKLKDQLADAAKKQIKFPKTEEEVTEWVQKYPDVAAIVETIAMKKVADVRKEIDEKDAVLREKAYEVEFNKQLNRIVSVHSDFFDVREDSEFIDWLQKQPKYVRIAFSDETVEFDDLEDVADTVISAIKLFKAESKPKKTPNDNNRDAARTVITKTSSGGPQDRPEKTFLLSEIDKMPIKEYEKHEKEILQAWQEGRIIDDRGSAA